MVVIFTDNSPLISQPLVRDGEKRGREGDMRHFSRIRDKMIRNGTGVKLHELDHDPLQAAHNI